MKNGVFIGLLSILISTSGLASETVTIGVNGMVCSFCAQGIEKKFKANEAVNIVDVKLENHEVTLGLKDGKSISDEEITKALKASGYSVEKITRK